MSAAPPSDTLASVVDAVSAWGWQALLLPLLPVLAVASALCSASETALFSLTHNDRLRMRRAAPRALAAASELLRQPRSLLVAILLANVTINTAFFTLAGMAGRTLFASGLGFVLFSAASVLLLILVAEVLPKAIAARHRVAVTRVVAVPVLAWFSLITPVRLALDRLVIAPLSRLARPAGTPDDPASSLTVDDLSQLLATASSQGDLHQSEQQLLGDVVQLGELRVKEIMTPRIDVRWLDATATSQELLQLARDTGFSRFPVCRGAFNERQVVGIVHAQRVLPLLAKQGVAARIPLASLVEPVLFVPERARVDRLLDLFRSKPSNLAPGVALVVSELGEVTGMVQVDNVLAELMTFAAGETDADAAAVRMVALGEWEAPGRLSVRDWDAFFDPGVELRERRVSTLAGLILQRLGRLPKVGEQVVLGNLALRIEELRGRAIERVRIRVLEVSSSPQPTEAAP